jgi:CHAD domain-containing protein
MAFQLKARRSASRELVRVFSKQLTLAIRELRRAAGLRDGPVVHEARRHIKKARAVLRLVQPQLGHAYRPANRRLREAGRMLAPLADRAAVVDAIDAWRRSVHGKPEPAVITRLRRRLASHQQFSPAQVGHMLRAATRIIEREREPVSSWALRAHGFRGLMPGLERAIRRARDAMADAAERPAPDTYHRWRRRVKNLWLQVRLIERRCGNGLSAYERDLERLDGILGDSHNVFLLERRLAAEPILPRAQTARCLRSLRRMQSDLRTRALDAGGTIFKQQPHDLVKQIGSLWRPRNPRRRSGAEPWRRAA